MKIIDNVVEDIRAKNEKFEQAFSINDVIEWFKESNDKKSLKFINWDFDNFYASSFSGTIIYRHHNPAKKNHPPVMQGIPSLWW